VATGLIRAVTGITRNPDLAKEAAVSFGSFPPITFDGTTDVLTLKILTRIGTNADDTKYPGHSSATGLRLYFDAASLASSFGAHFQNALE